MEPGKREFREWSDHVKWRSLVRSTARAFGRWLLLCAVLAAMGFLISGDDGTFLFLGLLAVALLPLVIFSKFIVGPRFPYLRKGYLWVAAFGIILGFGLIPMGAPTNGTAEMAMIMVRWLAIYEPVALILTVIYGWLVRLARLDDRTA